MVGLPLVRYIAFHFVCSFLLTLYTLTSVCIPHTVSLHFLRFREGEFVQQTRASLVFDDFP